MSLENVEDSVKVIVVGNGGVGKSSLVRRYCKGDFTTEYKKTIGADFLEKDVFVKSLNDNVKIMLWDTAGQEVFDALTSQYYRGAGACVLAFSTTDRESFDAIKGWKEKVENVCGKGNVAMALIQTKIDLIDQTVVNTEEAERLALQLGVKFFRTSTKENFNVDPVFEYLAETYIHKGSSTEASMPIAQGSKASRGDAPAVKQFASADAPNPGSGGPTTSSSSGGSAPATQQPIRVTDEPATRRAKRKKRWTCTVL